MSVECKTFRELDDDWERFLGQDPRCVFTKGACHAFAIELFEFLSTSLGGGTAHLFGLRKTIPLSGDHVVVGAGDRFLDVTKTPMTRDALMDLWGEPEPTSIKFLLKVHDITEHKNNFPASQMAPQKGTVDLMAGIAEKMVTKTVLKN